MAELDEQTRIFEVTPEEISAADIWIEEVGRLWGMAERTTFGARICVAEIAANVLEHGTPTASPPEFGVTLRRSGNALDIEITDAGQPFNVMTAPAIEAPHTIEEAQIGGLGLRLVRSYASNISYRHDGVCNHLRLQVPAGA